MWNTEACHSDAQFPINTDYRNLSDHDHDHIYKCGYNHSEAWNDHSETHDNSETYDFYRETHNYSETQDDYFQTYGKYSKNPENHFKNNQNHAETHLDNSICSKTYDHGIRMSTRIPQDHRQWSMQRYEFLYDISSNLQF